jgi:8-oxo-dGTP diphosphatase
MVRYNSAEFPTGPAMFTDQIKKQYHQVFKPFIDGHSRGQYELMTTPPPARLISNVNLVPKVGAEWLIILDDNGNWDIPGGTLEPGETYMDAIQREMQEEAGAKIWNFQLFSALHYISSAPEPYRPHLPHPDFYRVIGVGEVEIIGPIADPDGNVVSIDLVSIAAAVHRFESQNRPDLAAFYQIGAEFYSETRNP